MSATAVSIEKLKFSYPNGPVVLDIGSLHIRKGEHVFLYGPSGCGKTTLLSLITGILDAPDGTIEILGQDFSALKRGQRDSFRGGHIGYIFQMFNLIPYLSVKENICLPARVNRVRREKMEGGEWLAELSEKLGISDLHDKNVLELSVGQQQRVAAARALAGRPELIIADEPTSALDLDSRESFISALFEGAERSGATILFVSHDHSLQKMFHRSISLPELNGGKA